MFPFQCHDLVCDGRLLPGADMNMHLAVRVYNPASPKWSSLGVSEAAKAMMRQDDRMTVRRLNPEEALRELALSTRNASGGA
jgi:hypothetical protein